MTLPFLETGRLSFERPTPNDLNFLEQVYGSPEMMKHLGGAQSRSFVTQRLAEMLEHWTRHGHGYCIVSLKETGERIGIASLIYETIEGKTYPDLGWMILPKFQRKGYAREAAKALDDILQRKARPDAKGGPKVTSASDNGPGSLRQAVQAAKAGQTITFTLKKYAKITLKSATPVSR